MKSSQFLMQLMTILNGNNKQLSQTYMRIIGVYFFFAWSNILSGQVVIKGNTQLYVKSDAILHSDTIIYIPSTAEESSAKLYVVKGTISSHLVDNTEIEIIYHEAPNSKQKKIESTLTQSKKADSPITPIRHTPQPKKKIFLNCALDGNLDLMSGIDIIIAAVTFTPSGKKEISLFKEELNHITSGIKAKLFNPYFEEKIVSNFGTESIKVRPPPPYI